MRFRLYTRHYHHQHPFCFFHSYSHAHHPFPIFCTYNDTNWTRILFLSRTHTWIFMIGLWMRGWWIHIKVEQIRCFYKVVWVWWHVLKVSSPWERTSRGYRVYLRDQEIFCIWHEHATQGKTSLSLSLSLGSTYNGCHHHGYTPQ